MLRIEGTFQNFNDCKEGDIGMKSSFLLVLTLLCSTLTWGQTRTTRTTRTQRTTTPRVQKPQAKRVQPTATLNKKKTQPAPVKKVEQTTATTETVSKTEVIVKKTPFEKFSDRLKIGYFGAYQGSSLGQWDYSALDEKGAKTKDYAHNLWNQVSFNYNFGWKMNFVINPRFVINTGSTRYHAANDKGLVSMVDTLVGIQGVVLSSADKKFNLWTRPGIRLPNSRSSRAGDITMQPEALSLASYDFNPKWQLGLYNQVRWWVYEQRYNSTRYRIYNAPYLQYAITDKDKVAIWYENYIENRRNRQSFNKQKHRMEDYWNNAMVSYARDITPKINFMPFIGYFLDTTYAYERPLDAAWVGFWLSVQLK